MSDTEDILSEVPEKTRAKLESIDQTTKKNFNLAERVKNRGLRKLSITLFLDEELGAELGDAYTVKDPSTMEAKRVRTGIVGRIDEIEANLRKVEEETTKAATAIWRSNVSAIEEDKREEYLRAREREIREAAQPLIDGFNAELEELRAKRDEMVKKLEQTGITISMRAVPPVIQKDARRLAKQTLGIEEKGIPADREEDFKLAEFAHLTAMLVQSVRDNQSGSINDGMSYEDVIALIEYLPSSQFLRLDYAVGELQYVDAISRSIEGQEDFS